MKNDNVQMGFAVEPAVNKKLINWAKRLRISKSALIRLIIIERLNSSADIVLEPFEEKSE